MRLITEGENRFRFVETGKTKTYVTKFTRLYFYRDEDKRSV